MAMIKCRTLRLLVQKQGCDPNLRPFLLCKNYDCLSKINLIVYKLLYCATFTFLFFEFLGTKHFPPSKSQLARLAKHRNPSLESRKRPDSRLAVAARSGTCSSQKFIISLGVFGRDRRFCSCRITSHEFSQPLVPWLRGFTTYLGAWYYKHPHVPTLVSFYIHYSAANRFMWSSHVLLYRPSLLPLIRAKGYLKTWHARN